MKWLTQKYIREQARKSKKAAIKVSWQHWEQLATATEEELQKAVCGSIQKQKTSIYSEFCGLCQRYGKEFCCQRRSCPCPLQCAGLWDETADAFLNWQDESQSHSTFTRAARAMADRLKRLYEECR